MAKWEERIESKDLLLRATAKRFIEIFKEAKMFEKFDVELFFKLVEKIVVLNERLLVVCLLDDTEIEVEIV